MNKLVLGALGASVLALWSGSALAIDGCAPGTYNTTVSPDKTSYSTIFDDWFLDASRMVDVATCLVTIPLETGAASGTIVVYTSDVRGFYSLDDASDQADIEIDQNGTETSITATGPDVQDYTDTKLVAATGDEVVIDGKIERVNGSGNAIVTVDSQDLTELGRVTTPTDQTAAVVHLGASAGLLTGGLQPIEGENEIGFIGGYGSYMFGATGRFNITDGVSVLGGLSLVNQTVGASQTGGLLGAASLRYVEPGINTFRLMAEGGLVAGGLQTTYPNTTGPVATGLGSIFVKGGIVTDLAPETQLAFYGTLAETGLASDAFTQTFTGFTVNVPAQTGFFTTVKGTVAVTTELAPQVDLTAEASAGMVMSHSGMTATIPGIGAVSGAQDSGFVDYGLRLGWAPDPSVRLEVFGQGSIGQDTGMHNQIGASAKLKF